jgi:hypothetical protein
MLAHFPPPMTQALHQGHLSSSSESDLMAAISSSLMGPSHGLIPEVESAR